MTTLTGKITKLAMNIDAPKKSGGTFKAHAVALDTEEGTILIGAGSPAGKYAVKLGLAVGDEVTIEKGGEFNSVQKIQKKNFTPKFSSGFKKGKTFDNSGQIKGMVLNNAVQIALKGEAPVTKEAIIEAAKTVLEARKEVDQLVEATLPKTTSEFKSFDPFASLESAVDEPKDSNFTASDEF